MDATIKVNVRVALSIELGEEGYIDRWRASVKVIIKNVSLLRYLCTCSSMYILTYLILVTVVAKVYIVIE